MQSTLIGTVRSIQRIVVQYYHVLWPASTHRQTHPECSTQRWWSVDSQQLHGIHTAPNDVTFSLLCCQLYVQASPAAVTVKARCRQNRRLDQFSRLTHSTTALDSTKEFCRLATPCPAGVSRTTAGSGRFASLPKCFMTTLVRNASC